MDVIAPPDLPLDLERLDAARQAATWFAARVKNREAQVRRSFIQLRPGRQGPTALARLMRGGRGGEVRTKLLLSFLWVGAQPPHGLTFPARSWAELLGLPDPVKGGATRIRQATEWLKSEAFVSTENRPGSPTRITLLREDGSGVPYSVPGAQAVVASERGRGLEAHRYVRLPPTLWTNGWIAVLSAPALAALLILLAEQRRKEISNVWLAPERARSLYTLSDQTRYRGLAELEEFGLVQRERLALAEGRYEFQRYRNAYLLHMATFDDKPSLGAITSTIEKRREARAVTSNDHNKAWRSRVEKIGKIAYLHQEFLQANGSMTRADSLRLRRQIFGSRVQSSANLFGTKASGAILYRDVKYGSPIKDDDPIRLTDEGVRLAKAYREMIESASDFTQ